MPFEKGNKLGKLGAGVRDTKNRQWEDVGTFLITEGSERFLLELQTLEGKEYVQAFKDILEYFKPKQQRTVISGEKDAPLNIQLLDFTKK